MHDNDQKNQAGRRIGASISAPGFWYLLPYFLLSFFSSAGCSEQQAASDQQRGAEKSTATISSISSGATPSPSALDSSAAPKSAPSAAQSAAPTENASFAGDWEGAYDAKKGSVVLPSSVKDKVRKADDGKKAVGAGKVLITISAEGELAGKLEGALGKASLRGKAEGTMVRASIFPDDPSDAFAMTGVLVGMLKDGVIAGEIRVAGPDASVVRESLIELRKKN